jgi:hypothetical protein
VTLFDRVSMDGRPGTAVGFFARRERSVLIRFDDAEVLEVPETLLVVEKSRVVADLKLVKPAGPPTAPRWIDNF